MASSPDTKGLRRVFVWSGIALFVLIVGTNLPSPLYAVYAQRFGFGPMVLTLIFATYAGTQLPALLLAGSAADAWGYRRVLLPGLGLALAGTLVFRYADGTGWLFLARALQGAAVGTSSGALTAALVRTEPTGDHRRASLVASLAATGGGGLGPIIAGACAAWLPAPTQTSYLIESAALIAVAAGLLMLPASLGRTGVAWRVSLPRIPDSIRRPFAKACAVTFVGWAVIAVFLSIVPSYVRTLTGNHNLALAGVSSGLVLAVAAVAQLPASRFDTARLQRAGLVSLAAGLGVLLVAGASRQLSLVIASAVIAGIGQGLAYMGAVRHANRLAPKQTQAAVISAFYIATYLGVGVPVVGVGLLATVTSTTTAVDIFAVIALIGSLSVAAMRLGEVREPADVADSSSHLVVSGGRSR
jgi:MFS family permease